MKGTIGILCLTALFLAAISMSSSGQEGPPAPVVNDDSSPAAEPFKPQDRALTSDELDLQTGAGMKKDLTTEELDEKTGAGMKKDLTTEELDEKTGAGLKKDLPTGELDDQTGAGLKKDLPTGELDDQTGAGLRKDLTTDELDVETGAGIKHVSVMELQLASGRGFGSDMTLTDMENMVGQGFIDKLTPDEIDRISAQGTLSPEEARLTIQDLSLISAQGVKFIVDTSKFSAEELEEIKGRGTLQDVGKYPYSIQVGVFRDKENAIAMLETVRGKGYDPYIFRTRDDLGNSLFAVRLGDYETIQEAYAEVTHYKGKEHKEAFVTYINSTQNVKKEDVLASDEEADLADTEPVDFDKEYASQDLRAIHKQIQSLQSEVDKLRAEAEARKKLQMTEAESQQEEEEILSAAGREYVLSSKGTVGLDYSFGYSHSSYDQALWDTAKIIHTADHSLTNSVSANYALFDNFTLNASVPFMYKYHDLGNNGSKDVSDVGDMNFGASWQPIKSGAKLPPIIVTAGFSVPTGRSPYEINPEVDLSTGSGVFGLTLGVNSNKKMDPVVVFGGLAYSYQLPATGLDYHLASGVTMTEVEPSDGVALNLGLGYAMSYAATINASFSASYAFGSNYKYNDGSTSSTGSELTASLGLGTGWRFSAKRTISFSIGMGLTNDASDFSFSFRIPYDFEL